MPSEFPTSVRLPEATRRELRKIAKAEKRSMTDQIVFVLEQWLKARAEAESMPWRGIKLPSEVKK